MGREPPIEPIRSVPWTDQAGGYGDESGGEYRRSRGRRRRSGKIWRRRLLALVLFLLLVLAILFVVARARDCGGASGGDFAGTWQKRGTAQQIKITALDDPGHFSVVAKGGHTAMAGELDGDVLKVPSALGVKGLDLSFTLKDGGTILVERFPNGSEDELTRVK